MTAKKESNDQDDTLLQIQNQVEALNKTTKNTVLATQYM